MDVLAGLIITAALAAGLARLLPAPVAFAGGGLLCGAAMAGGASQEAGRLLVEGAALLFFLEAGLRLTDRHVWLVRSARRAVLRGGLPCMAAVFAAGFAGALALGTTVPQSLFAGLVLLPAGMLLPPRRLPMRTTVLLGHGAAGLAGLIALPLLSGTAVPPAWSVALRYVFICIGFVSIALVVRHGFTLHRLAAAAVVLGVAGAAAWVGPGLGFAFFLAGLMLSRGRWRGQALFTLLPAPRTLYAPLFLAGLGLLAASPAVLALMPGVASVAGGLLFLRAATVALCAGSRPVAAVGRAPFLGPLLAPLSAAAFPVLYAGLDAHLLPQAWTAAAPSLLAAVALALAAGAAAERRLWSVLRARSKQRAGPRKALLRQAPRQRLCTGPFIARKRRNGQVPRLHLIQVGAGAPATRLSLHRLALHRRFDVQVVGLWRRDVYVPAPSGDFTLQAEDRVLLSAAPARLSRSTTVFRPSSGLH